MRVIRLKKSVEVEVRGPEVEGLRKGVNEVLFLSRWLEVWRESSSEENEVDEEREEKQVYEVGNVVSDDAGSGESLHELAAKPKQDDRVHQTVSHPEHWDTNELCFDIVLEFDIPLGQTDSVVEEGRQLNYKVSETDVEVHKLGNYLISAFAWTHRFSEVGVRWNYNADHEHKASKNS